MPNFITVRMAPMSPSIPNSASLLRSVFGCTTLALAYADADRIVCPTPFQAGLLPEAFRPRVSIIHEGVDTERVKVDPGTKLTLSNGHVLDRSAPVITFINRRFEPLRGFHIFLRAAAAV